MYPCVSRLPALTFCPSIAVLESDLFPTSNIYRYNLMKNEDNPLGPPLSDTGWLNGELVNFLVQ